MTIRRVGKWALCGLAILVVFFGLYLSVFFFPFPFFPHHVEYGAFDVYSDGEIPEDFETVVDDAWRRVERMELFRGNAKLRIFVCRSQRFFVVINRLAGRRHFGQALVISAAGNAFFSVEGIEAIGWRNGGEPVHSRLEGSWSAAIAHEVAHLLIGAELEGQEDGKIPPWKAEGYADFQANRAPAEADPEYNFAKRVDFLLDDGHWRPPVTTFDRRHFRWHVLVEFLCAVKGLTFKELLDASVTEEDAREELMTWHATRLSTDPDATSVPKEAPETSADPR